MDINHDINTFHIVNGFRLLRRPFGVEMFTIEEMVAAIVAALGTMDPPTAVLRDGLPPFGATADGQHRRLCLELSNSVNILVEEGLYTLVSHRACAPRLFLGTKYGRKTYERDVHCIEDVERIVRDGIEHVLHCD